MKKSLLWIVVLVLSISMVAAFSLYDRKAAVVEAKEDITVYFLVMGMAGDPYHETIVKGARKAADVYGINLNVFYGEADIKTQVDQLETAIVAAPDGICFYLSNPEAFDDPVQRAIDAGIPIVALSLDDPEGASGNPRLAYIGPELLESGRIIAKRMLQYFEKGDHVLVTAEHAGMVYATLRYQGIDEVLSAEGITTELLDCTHERSEIISRTSTYMIGNPETKGIIGVGALVTADAGRVVKDLDLKNKVYVGGFDLNEDTLKWIKEGYIQATVDAQPFLIGYLSVQQFYFHYWAGFNFMNIDTGTGIVDEGNIDKVLEFPEPMVR